MLELAFLETAPQWSYIVQEDGWSGSTLAWVSLWFSGCKGMHYDSGLTPSLSSFYFWPREALGGGKVSSGFLPSSCWASLTRLRASMWIDIPLITGLRPAAHQTAVTFFPFFYPQWCGSEFELAAVPLPLFMDHAKPLFLNLCNCFQQKTNRWGGVRWGGKLYGRAWS